MDAFEAMARRTSVRRYAPDALPRELIAQLLDAAVRAPNHKLTEPWRFVVLTGGARNRFAEIRRAQVAKKFDDPGAPEAAAKVEKAFREQLLTPAMVVVIQLVDEDPVRREEDYAAVMMATQNLMIAATASGLGTFLRTGGIMKAPDMRSLAGAREGEAIVGIVSLGRPAAPAEPVKRTPAAEKTTWLD